MSFPVQCGCGARFALGLLRCPRCRAVSPQYAKSITKEQDMPRITVAGGPSNADARPGEVGYIGPQDVTQEDVAAHAPEAPAVPAAAGDAGPLEGDASSGPAPDYATLTVPQLREAAKERALPTGGTKPELVERLTAATQAPEGGD